MELVDKLLVCEQCKKSFPFSSQQQAFFLEKAFVLPKRCPDCRIAKKKYFAKQRTIALEKLKSAPSVK